ncbi:hypothetical protein TWF694_002226 [Orbilia ellipsospora]|uniref:Uncharacterized protein n=1 Tax=Orbilia ellipsospora TaxID=2528407 RepID=A0AAV9X1C1_9PEZI
MNKPAGFQKKMWKSLDSGIGKLTKPKGVSSSPGLGKKPKRGASLLRKESKAQEVETRPGQNSEADGDFNPTLKRRFSFRETVRKVLGRKHKRSVSEPVQHQLDVAHPQAPSRTIEGNEPERPEKTDLVAPESLVPPSGAPIDGRFFTIDETTPSAGDLPPQVLSTASESSISSLSSDSLKTTSAALLSPRPTERLRLRKPSDGKPSPPGNGMLVESDILTLFEGAPVFYVDETSGKYGNPSVRYTKKDNYHPYDLSLAFSRDAKIVDHDAFKGCSNRLPRGTGALDPQHHWLNGPVETPSMLSFTGLEPGTTGWQYFLETQMEDFQLQQGSATGEVDEYGLEYHHPDSIGVRSIDSTTMIDRLRDIGRLHRELYSLDKDLDIESRTLYGQLFTKILYPATCNAARAEEYGLESQCRELFKILEERHVWLDFSRPEERIRLGSILYGTGQEKLLLVLQILLSCELWLRLKILHKYVPEKLELESLYFTPKVNWDLTIAQVWLSNVRIVERPFTPDFDMLTPVPQTSAWHQFFLSDDISVEDAGEPQDADTYDAFFVPQHIERQLDGLLYFARKINWPGIEMLEGVIRDKLRNPTGFHTPSSILGRRSPAHSPGKLTPRSIGGATRSSYFSYFAGKHTSSAIVQNIGQGGWLSRTFTTGLILPGEGISHLLMGCLLENDTLALNEIGEQGSMYGGIIRKTLEPGGSTASWWSTNNVVGRVLATETSQGTVGWVGKCVGTYSIAEPSYQDVAILSAVAAKLTRSANPHPPRSSHKREGKCVEPIGWVDVMAVSTKTSYEVPRLSMPDSIERESGILGPFKLSGGQMPARDIHYPISPSFEAIDILILGLRFWDHKRLATTSLPEREQGYRDNVEQTIPRYRVEVVFQLPGIDLASGHIFHSVERDTVGILLKHDVSFITSYPCSQMDGLRDRSGFEATLSKFNFPVTSTHPIHSSFKYQMVNVAVLASYCPSRRSGSTEGEYSVTIINAKGTGEGLYVYTKAWCAKWGVDALVTRSDRTCLSCAIREAYAIAVDVIIER